MTMKRRAYGVSKMTFMILPSLSHHPGGSFWLEWTRGTDITEAFESHHISKAPENMLAKFHVRSTSKPRNYKLTLHDNGFYRVLKSRVRTKLKNVDRSPERRTDVCIFLFLYFFMEVL